MAMLAEPPRISHRKARALLKKEKRKRKRQEEAKKRQAELAIEEDIEAENLEEEEIELEAERQRLHVEWLEKEQQAQEEFRLKKEKEEAARKKQEEEERRIREEWEQQQMKEKEQVEHKQQERREREEAVQKMLDQAENQLENGSTWHNPEAPEDYGTEKDKSYCPFFLKTGSCRFGDRCSRKHVYPASSQTLLIRAMFITFGMEESRRDDYDTDSGLEHSEEDIYQQFVEFYEDVLPEFKSVGKVIQFKVSCNYEPHLRGNVYVQYQKEEECQQAFALFNGRWYAGKQLQCEFSPVTRWKTAICGLYERRKCPRGKHCNFLHVFRNPNSEFWEADRDLYISPDRTKSYSNKYFERRERTSYRHDYHSRSRRRYSCSPDKTHRRSGESERKRKRSRSKDRRRLQRSRSKSQDRRRSRSRERYRRSQSKETRRSQRSRSRSGERRRSRSRDGSWCRSRSISEERSLSRSKSRSRSRSKRTSRDRSGSRGLGTERSRSRSKSKLRSRSRSPLGWNRKRKRGSENKDKKSKKRAKKEKKAKSKADGKSKGSKTRRQDDEHRNSPVSQLEKDAQIPAHDPEARGLSTSPSTKSSASDLTAPAKLEETAETEAINQ
ncbi:U2 small nuclear ribonucleoprotein auxiliary factor 35 kDa subunit-related protein 2 [Stegostoma tigrinum]|uniref:U2 small nuclear ribonucleoprotein auxiliary factor 35 kDa subunit-related protein 2 n=1 Tax=Stegostoma tigrinum TaxID=3053191 RepID=UPI00202B9219|nr:U2 small nuclear ribonucleoprotein auxiliary factor 35 kDa subunit-related protein 2 [Stegostoma tigrinum]